MTESVTEFAPESVTEFATESESVTGAESVTEIEFATAIDSAPAAAMLVVVTVAVTRCGVGTVCLPVPGVIRTAATKDARGAPQSTHHRAHHSGRRHLGRRPVDGPI